MSKPSLGAPPTWMVARKRVKELADAISRSADDAMSDNENIRRWASEILMQVDILLWDENERKGRRA